MLFHSLDFFQILPVSPPIQLQTLSKKKTTETKIYKQKITKTKNTQTKQTKTTTELLLWCCSWAWNLPWSVVYILSETPLEKGSFSFASGYQVQIASWLGVGAVFTSPQQCCDSIWRELAHAAASLWVSMCISPVMSGRHCFLGVAQVPQWKGQVVSYEIGFDLQGSWGATLGRTTEVGRRRRGRHSGTRNKALLLSWPFLHNLKFSLATITRTSLQRCECRYVYVHMPDTGQMA